MKKVSVFLVLFFILVSFSLSKSRGKFEVGFHYSYWTINFLGKIIEEGVADSIDEFDSKKGDLNFKSDGNNFGFEIRFFPGGENGSFSIGLSYERNNFKGTLDGAYEDQEGGNRLEVKADGSFDLRPHSFNLSFRWELWARARVHPYIGIGFGIGPANGNLRALVTKELYSNGTLIGEEETLEEKTLKEVLDPLTFFPIIHLNFGIRGEIIDNLYLLAEFAIYDGLIFRGGLAYRF